MAHNCKGTVAWDTRSIPVGMLEAEQHLHGLLWFAVGPCCRPVDFAVAATGLQQSCPRWAVDGWPATNPALWFLCGLFKVESTNEDLETVEHVCHQGAVHQKLF